MSGIYIHIPFCRQACNYCDFHFSTSLKGKEDLLKSIRKEIENIVISYEKNVKEFTEEIESREIRITIISQK